MPTAYVRQEAKKKGVSVGRSETQWDKAKADAKGGDWGLVTHIYKNRMKHIKQSSLDYFLSNNFEKTSVYEDVNTSGLSLLESAAVAAGIPLSGFAGATAVAPRNIISDAKIDRSITKGIERDIDRAGYEIFRGPNPQHIPGYKMIELPKGIVPEIAGHELGHAYYSKGFLAPEIYSGVKTLGKGVAYAMPLAAMVASVKDMPQEKREKFLDAASAIAAGSYGATQVLPEVAASAMGVGKMIQHGGWKTPVLRPAGNLSRALLTYLMVGAGLAGAPQVLKHLSQAPRENQYENSDASMLDKLKSMYNIG